MIDRVRLRKVTVNLDMGGVASLINLPAPEEPGDAVPLSKLNTIIGGMKGDLKATVNDDPGDLTLLFANRLI